MISHHEHCVVSINITSNNISHLFIEGRYNKLGDHIWLYQLTNSYSLFLQFKNKAEKYDCYSYLNHNHFPYTETKNKKQKIHMFKIFTTTRVLLAFSRWQPAANSNAANKYTTRHKWRQYNTANIQWGFLCGSRDTKQQYSIRSQVWGTQTNTKAYVVMYYFIEDIRWETEPRTALHSTRTWHAIIPCR